MPSCSTAEKARVFSEARSAAPAGRYPRGRYAHRTREARPRVTILTKTFGPPWSGPSSRPTEDGATIPLGALPENRTSAFSNLEYSGPNKSFLPIVGCSVDIGKPRLTRVGYTT
jgi:hypothetical protein